MTDRERVDAAIARFRAEHPDRPVPNVLLRWLDLMPGAADIAWARRRLAQPDMQAELARLRG